MANLYEAELETELEDEFHEGELESEDESSLEGEGWLGAIGNLLSESEEELEDESAFESGYESAFESEEEFEDESSLESEGEGAYEDESFFESEDEGEQFFGKIGKFLKKLPLKNIAKIVAPLVGTAIGGPFGTALGGLAAKALGEGEYEDESELHGEGEREMVHEIAAHELSHHEALAEMMAEAASHEVHEGEAEAMAGAAALTVISPRDRRALRRILPHMIRGTAILTRILRRRKATRPLVRVVPTIVRRTIRDLKKQAARGVPISRKRAAITAAKQVRRVLGSPRACAAAITRNVKVSKSYNRPTQRRTRGTAVRRRHNAAR